MRPLVRHFATAAVLTFCACATSLTQAAENRWITDQLFIMMRTGEGNEFRIKRRLPSGAQVSVISSNQQTGYSLIRYRGDEGYVLSRQLMNEPAARERLEAAKAEAGSALNQFERLTGELNTSKTELEQTKRQLSEVSTAFNDLESQYQSLQAKTDNVQRIIEENQALQEAVNAYEAEKEEIFEENKQLRDQNAHRWVMIGGGLVFTGILTGLIIPNLRSRRRETNYR